MSRSIEVSGGFSGWVVLDVTDTLGALGGASYKVALVAEGQQWPAVGNAAWVDVAGTGDGSRVVVSRLVTGGTPAGRYHVAVDVFSGGAHELVWVMDEGSVERRAVLRVR